MVSVLFSRHIIIGMPENAPPPVHPNHNNSSSNKNNNIWVVALVQQINLTSDQPIELMGDTRDNNQVPDSDGDGAEGLASEMASTDDPSGGGPDNAQRNGLL